MAALDQALVQICSYNSNMQGEALAQDLVDWLAPTLTTASFLANRSAAPDILVVGFQELLPLHLGFTGRSAGVINSRDALIRAAIEKHNKTPYLLVAKIVNVGVAMLVYAKDEENGIASRIRGVETQWTSFGPLWMGNKSAVGVRFLVAPKSGSQGPGEIFTFVNAHLTAHSPKLDRRLADYQHIVRTLLFSPIARSPVSPNIPSTIYDTSHLFFFGDLNFRLAPSLQITPSSTSFPSAPELFTLNSTLDGRRHLAQHDQLRHSMREGRAFIGLREGEFEQFPCSYKYVVGKVGEYSGKRTPSWTDRILYTTHSDSPDKPLISNIRNILYTSVLAFTKSDHKPITGLLLVPASSPAPPQAHLQQGPGLPPLIDSPPLHLNLTPHPCRRLFTRVLGKTLDWVIGWIWLILWLLGAGNAGIGIGTFGLGAGGLLLWRRGGIF